jgi:hypothetical protein
MANNILLKKSSVSSKVPTTSDLDYGELALNYADGALYYKTSANAIARLNPIESIGFANVAVSGQSTVVADTATGTLTLAAGNGAITLTTNASTDTVTISHTDTSSVANLSSDNSAGVVLQDIAFTFDTYGHVQTATVATTDLDSRYLQSESDTLATVTTRGATTTNAITVGGLTVNGDASITGDVSGVDSLTFDTTATEANAVGKLYWNANDGTLSFGLAGGNSINHIGQHLTNYVYNDDTTTINKGEVVYLFGAHGNRASVKKASNSAEATSSKTVGVASENIAPGAVGFVVSHGVVDGLSLGAYNPGDTVYLGSTPGSITTTLPVAPYHTVFVGVIARANNGNGQLFVKIQNGLQVDELHDVQISGLANNDSLFYDSSTYVWKNTTPTNARTKLGLGTIATQNANTVAITGGAIDGTPIGATTASTGKFTTLQTTGNVTVGGNLTVTGTTVTISTQNLAVQDNLIYLNDGSTVTNPDLGFAGNYNDGTYRHAGFFRDATDGYWKVFKNYTLEPDASPYIDTGHASFALADIQAANFRGALVGNADSATILAYNRTINGVTFNGSANITITANTTNALTIGSGLSGTSFNGSSAVTITVDNTVARVNDVHYIGTTSIALNRASAAQTLTGVSIDGNSATVTNGVYTTDTATVTNTMLAGSIANTKLLNSAITIAGTSTSLGGSITLDTITGLSTTGIIKRTGANTLAIATAGTDYVVPSGSITGSAGSVANVLTIGSYLTGGSYNGSAAITIAADATSLNTASKLVARDASGNFSAGTITANLTGTASGNLTSSSTLTAGNLSGTIPSGVLGNSTVYIGTTAILLNRASLSQTLTGVGIDGNAGTVTNGVYTTGSYANPSWISSLAGSKITGDITGNASNITSYTINQNVGSTNSPSFSGLTVNGNLRVTGIFYDSANSAGTSGQVLTSTGTGTAWSSSGAAVTGSGTANYIPKWSTTTALANSILQESSSKIGINTNPACTLDISGATNTDGSITYNQQLSSTAAYSASPVSGTNVGLKYNSAGTGAGMGGWTVGKENATDGDYASYFAIHARANGAAVTEKVRVTSAGNVGIGTSSPSVKLHVAGDAKIGANSQRISLFDDGNAHIHSTTGPLWLNSDDGGDIRINNQTNGNVVLTNGTGSVGIGTNSPTQRLDVGGNIAWGTNHVLSYSTLTTTATTANQVITAVSSTAYRTAKFIIQAVDATAGKYQSQEILAIHNGSTVAHTEYTAINVGGAVSTFDVDISAGTLRLLCTPLSSNSTVFKVSIELIKV